MRLSVSTAATGIASPGLLHAGQCGLDRFIQPGGRHRNNEVQFAGTFGERGVRYTLTVEEGQLELLSRQVMPYTATATACSRLVLVANALVSAQSVPVMLCHTL